MDIIPVQTTIGAADLAILADTMAVVVDTVDIMVVLVDTVGGNPS